MITVDCLKITEDKSSKSRVYTPDARLIIASRVVLRRNGRSTCLNITVMAKTLSLKAAPQHHCSTKCEGWSPRLCFTARARRRCWSLRLSHLCNTKTQNSKPAFSRVWSPRLARFEVGIQQHYNIMPKCEARNQRFNCREALRLGYNCPHYWVNYCPLNEGS